MIKDFDEILQTCLELIQGGQETVDSAVARYPELAEDLRPILEASLWIGSAREGFEPRPGFVTASRRRLVARIQEEQLQKPVSWREKLRQLLTTQQVAPVAFVVVLLLALFVSGTVVTVSQRALPGDGLYSVKQMLEQLALATSFDQANDAALQIRFVNERLEEFKALIAEGRYEEAKQVVAQYELDVRRTLELLEVVRDQDDLRAGRLALELESILASQQSLFEFLMASEFYFPFQDAIARVIDASRAAQDAAQEFSVDDPAYADAFPAHLNPIPNQYAPYDPHPSANRATGSDQHASTDQHAGSTHEYSLADCYQYTGAADGHAYPNQDTQADGYPDGYPNSDTYGYADGHSDGHADGHTDEYAHRHSDGFADRYTNANRYTYTGDAYTGYPDAYIDAWRQRRAYSTHNAAAMSEMGKL